MISRRAAWTAKYDATTEPGPRHGNKPLRCNFGPMHQSRIEARRCNELHILQAGGLIRELEAHPQHRYRLDVNGVHICDYLVDFRYFEVDGDQEVLEDTKGFQTEVSKLKIRLVEALYGLKVQLVRKGR
jgi:hypothetical protein